MYDKISQRDFLPEHLSNESENMDKIRGIIARVEEEKLYKGKGGEIMRAGVCHLVHAISLSKIDLDSKTQQSFFSTLFENFKHPNQEI